MSKTALRKMKKKIYIYIFPMSSAVSFTLHAAKHIDLFCFRHLPESFFSVDLIHYSEKKN